VSYMYTLCNRGAPIDKSFATLEFTKLAKYCTYTCYLLHSRPCIHAQQFQRLVMTGARPSHSARTACRQACDCAVARIGD
jgi:hypothetical protein